MKKFLLLGILFHALFAESQQTFNKRLRFDFPAAVLTSIVPTDSFYLATGVIADSVFPYETGNIFLKTGLDGEPFLIKTITNANKTFETWFGGLHLLDDGTSVVPGISVDSIEKTILIKYSSNGDTIFTREFLNPFYPSYDRIQPRGGLKLLPDGGFLFSNWIISGNLPDSDIYLIKTDSLGYIEWDGIYGNSKWDRPQSLIIKPNNKYIIGAIRTNDNTTVVNYKYQTHIFQIDSIGNLEWDYLTPESTGLRDAANGMVLLDDGSLVIASGIGHEIERPSVNVVHFDKMLFKLSPNLDIEWEKGFPDGELTGSSRTTKIEKLADGSGFLLAGMSYEKLEPPLYFSIKGWLAKVSNEGDSIWTREYVFLTEGEDEHKIYDLKETPDGGFILCGEARDWSTGVTHPQQAWLLKVDGHGCLVPGCHLVDGVDEENMEGIGFTIYPNPAIDYLNFQLRSRTPLQDGQVRIINANGQLVRSIPITPQSGDTYIVPLWDWPTGAYFLQYFVNGISVGSEKFIIFH